MRHEQTEIQQLIFLVKKLDPLDDGHYLQPLTQYLAIMIMGCIENSIEDFFNDYIQRNVSHRPIINYFQNKLKSVHAPGLGKVEKLFEELGMIRLYTDNIASVNRLQPYKDSWTNLVNLRNTAAHGNYCQTSVD